MLKWPDLAGGFKMLREVDLSAVRRQAEAPVHLVVAGGSGTGKTTLIKQLLSGPREFEPAGIPPLSEHDLKDDIPLQAHSIVLLLLDGVKETHLPEQAVFAGLKRNKVPVIVCYNKVDLVQNPQPVMNGAQQWPGAEVAAIAAYDYKSLQKLLVPAILRACPGREVQLARRLPLLREPVCQKLIDDTCFVNSAYSLTTGLAEINVFLALPLNLADIIVLTKNQALMAYKIALAMGLPADWRETIPKLTAVVGSAFLWRQVARQLVGLIPGYGIIPKIAVAYAGTYAVGQAIYQWCANGEKLKPENLKSLYVSAFKRGREVAQGILAQRKALRAPGK
jgi:uncharacterized protein (DUF697 family)